MFFGKSHRAAAIEISNRSVKLAVVHLAAKGKPRVDFFAHKEYASKENLKEILHALFESVPRLPSVVGTSVWSRTLMTRKITVATGSGSQDWRDLALAEADKYLPFAVHECVLDSYLLEELPGHKADLMLVAAKKDLMVERCEFLKSLGVRLQFADVHPLVLNELFLATAPSEAFESSYGVLCVTETPGKAGGEENVAVFAKNGMPFVLRDLGEKFQQSMPPKEFWAQAAAQAKSAAVFFENAAQCKNPKIYLLTHPAWNAESAAEFTAAGLPAEIWDPAKLLEYSSEETRRTVAAAGTLGMVAIGAALRGCRS